MQKHPKRNIDPAFCVTLAAILLAAAVRVSLLSIPLERDEGGFAYMGRHLFSAQLYTDLHDNKLPGLYGLYALFIRLFGYTPEGIHAGLLVCNSIAIWLIYRLFGKVFNKWTGAVSAVIFALTSLSPNVNGFAAHANQLLMPFALGGLILMHRALWNGRLIYFGCAGLLLGLAFTIKQQVVSYGVFAGVWLLWERIQTHHSFRQIIRECVVFSAGSILPFAVICGYFFVAGRFDDLWMWTVELPAQLGNAPNIGDRYDLFQHYFSQVTGYFTPIWIMALAGWVIFPLWHYSRIARNFGMVFPLFCALSVLIGVAYYPHYFVLCLPAVGLLVGILTDVIRRKMPEPHGIKCAVLILFLVVSIPVISDWEYYFKPDFSWIHWKTYGANRFYTLQGIGKQLKAITQPGDQIAILGSEPEVLVVANREAASGHLFLYNLFSQGPKSALLQQQYLNDLKSSKPKYLLWVTAIDSWGGNYQETTFFNEIRAFLDSNYTLYLENTEILPEEQSILIYKRRSQ